MVVVAAMIVQQTLQLLLLQLDNNSFISYLSKSNNDIYKICIKLINFIWFYNSYETK
jgi:hypothetical protein